jgi:hypothetical protein
VLFAFLLTAPLAARFPELSSFQRHDYFWCVLRRMRVVKPRGR